MNVLLSGIVGSTAYGLAHSGSDVDRIGIFAAPTRELLGLHPPADYHGHKATAGDVSMYEVGKFVPLAIKCNPTISEVMWLPSALHEECTDLGEELIGIRSAFLSTKRVRGAYLGYAADQFARLRKRDGKSFSADTANRTAKHARHMYRLLVQGFELWSTGNLTVQLHNPEVVRTFGERIAGGDFHHAEGVLATFEFHFDSTPSVLPDQPDEAVVEDWLQRVRKHYYT